MKPWAGPRFHAWDGTAGVLLSDEQRQVPLQQFPAPDDAVNWLFVNGHKADARALAAHLKPV